MRLHNLLEESAAVQKLRETWKQEVLERARIPEVRACALMISPDGIVYSTPIRMCDFDRRYVQR